MIITWAVGQSVGRLVSQWGNGTSNWLHIPCTKLKPRSKDLRSTNQAIWQTCLHRGFLQKSLSVFKAASCGSMWPSLQAMSRTLKQDSSIINKRRYVKKLTPPLSESTELTTATHFDIYYVNQYTGCKETRRKQTTESAGNVAYSKHAESKLQKAREMTHTANTR